MCVCMYVLYLPADHNPCTHTYVRFSVLHIQYICEQIDNQIKSLGLSGRYLMAEKMVNTTTFKQSIV